MTMDTLELLARLGQVEPADPEVLDAALRTLAAAVGVDAHVAQPGRRRIWRRSWQTAVTAVTGAAAAVAVAAAVTVAASPGHPVPGGRAGGGGPRLTAPGPVATAGPSGTAAAVAAVLTAFSANSDDILMVTKTMSGDSGPLGKTVMWVAPAGAAPGTTVRSRILSYSLAGSRQSDQALSYTAPATAPASAGCDGIFRRPRVVLPPAAGLPGRLTIVNYLARSWSDEAVAVQAATVPSGAALQACLNEGQWRVVGHAALGGAKVIELAAPGGHLRLSVSAATYLPARLVSSAPGVDTITFAFRFLPPTPASRSSLTVPIPPGFARQNS
jgi:hypothetical protein